MGVRSQESGGSVDDYGDDYGGRVAAPLNPPAATVSQTLRAGRQLPLSRIARYRPPLIGALPRLSIKVARVSLLSFLTWC
jgi:hypothetical protein